MKEKNENIRKPFENKYFCQNGQQNIKKLNIVNEVNFKNDINIAEMVEKYLCLSNKADND